jgi:uncharacterized protein YecT (DUF1311 family)
MQLLEIVCRRVVFTFALFFGLVGYVSASTPCGAVSVSNLDIANCSKAAYEKIDKVLNEQYKSLMSSIDAPLKQELQTSQKIWIKLKENYCAADGENGSAGQEAAIEKLSCIKQFTSFRVSELIYLRTGVIGDGFYKAVSLVNEKTTAMDYAKAVDYVGGTMDFGPEWQDYAQKNCALTEKLFGEDSVRCLARMRFQMPIY